MSIRSLKLFRRFHSAASRSHDASDVAAEVDAARTLLLIYDRVREFAALEWTGRVFGNADLIPAIMALDYFSTLSGSRPLSRASCSLTKLSSFSIRSKSSPVDC